jgi:2-polyprenyl-3-methyl-5-hydroxy-6-metoxy-1,4-benzoquinol methylase
MKIDGVYMTKVKEKINTIPIKISQLLNGTWAIQALRSSLELKIFDQLEQAEQAASAIASALKADKRATEILLDALVAIGLLQKNSNKYSLTEESRTYLLSTSPLYIGSYVILNQDRESAWRQLSDVVRTGTPLDHVNEDKRAQEFFPALAEMIFPINFATAQRVAEELQIAQLPDTAKILDVAAGAATWSIPMALANSSVHVDALDFSTTLEVTKKFATKYGVADRYSYITGNWRDVKWNNAAYDVVILGHILHSEGEKLSYELIKRSFTALKPGGKLVIAEMIANSDRGGPPFAMLFGINMLINTVEGCVFTDSELNEMLSAAGFTKTYRMPVEEMPCSPIMIAQKAK